ncbi:glycoside hydrolase family 1 protein [Chondromyces apiculatus]|uniref:Beta-glucosidase n=1 Tax=Chondromyces apiculatus DSM 436 TaxID=1192034 RepID=A0A017SWZ9_9BACT|nr:family 1 glycosylhydrolase [Chondromyces apiculatus]EYF01478.1 Beta-glucosidase [Chondromyces apiculatus DSM 436]
MSAELGFPEDFLFGTATSATQVEGHCEDTDWSAFAREPGRVRGGATPRIACDHVHRFREDVKLQQALGLGAHRLSLEWARVEPRAGEFDPAAWDHYRAVLGAHRDAGIVPMITVHHFSLPRWLSARGGLLHQDLPALLARFAERAVEALGDLCTLWITINEPNVLAAHGHLLGVWPPGHHSLLEMGRALRNLLRAHEAMFRAMHDAAARKGHALQAGVAHHLRVLEPEAPGRAADRVWTALYGRVFNDWFTQAVCAQQTQDFFGLNYYTRDLVRFSPAHPGEGFMVRKVQPGAEVNDLGWEIYPEGLGRLLDVWAPRAGVPVYITENGIDDADDDQRPRFLVRHLAEVARAIRRGIDVRGYLHWSLMDNFEWAEGYAARFGLVEVDYATQERRPRPSAALYGRIARARAIDRETLAALGE